MKNKGFTLIELIIVIVILGILATVAAPRFIDFSSEARINLMKSVAAAMRGSAELIRTKAIIQNIDNGNVIVENLGLPSDQVLVFAGYPEGYWNGAWKYILSVGESIDFTGPSDACTINPICGVGRARTAPGFPEPLNGSDGLVLIWPENMSLSDLCYAYYYNREDGTEPSIGTVTSGC